MVNENIVPSCVLGVSSKLAHCRQTGLESGKEYTTFPQMDKMIALYCYVGNNLWKAEKEQEDFSRNSIHY